MKIKNIIQIGLLAVLATTILAAESSDKPSFTKLTEAVSFIVTCLDQNATNCFSAAFIEPKSGVESHKYVFIGLKRINATTPLTALYKGKDFPTNQPAFWLGGHFRELGCIHIGFVHTNGVWYLSDTFICR